MILESHTEVPNELQFHGLETLVRQGLSLGAMNIRMPRWHASVRAFGASIWFRSYGRTRRPDPAFASRFTGEP